MTEWRDISVISGHRHVDGQALTLSTMMETKKLTRRNPTYIRDQRITNWLKKHRNQQDSILISNFVCYWNNSLWKRDKIDKGATQRHSVCDIIKGIPSTQEDRFFLLLIPVSSRPSCCVFLALCNIIFLGPWLHSSQRLFFGPLKNM